MEGGPDLLRLSLASVPNDERLAVLREFFGPSLNMDISPLTPNPTFDFAAMTLPGVAVTRCHSSPHRVTRTNMSRENDDLVLGWSSIGGRGRMTVLGHEAADGAPVLWNCADPFVSDMHSEFRIVNVRIKRGLMAPLLPNAESAFMRPIAIDSPSFRLLNTYLAMLSPAEISDDPACVVAIAAHICDLFALSVGTTREVAAVAATRGVRAARFAAVKRWVLGRLDEPGLSVVDAAAAEKVSARYIQMLFEEEGMTFTAFLLKERLARAHRLLVNPTSATTPVSTIAFEVGFGDLSYFNRSFRAAYEKSPSDVRHDAMRESG